MAEVLVVVALFEIWLFGWIWGWFLAAIIVQEESATLSQLLLGVGCSFRDNSFSDS